jgi:hypothetical protein
LLTERQQGLAPAIGEEAKEADAHKAMRENVEKEAAQKLLGRYGHQLLFAALRIILPAEGNLTIGKGHDPVIRDGDTMCVPSQIMKNVQRTAERRFRVYDPVLTE